MSDESADEYKLGDETYPELNLKLIGTAQIQSKKRIIEQEITFYVDPVTRQMYFDYGDAVITLQRCGYHGYIPISGTFDATLMLSRKKFFDLWPLDASIITDAIIDDLVDSQLRV